VKCSVSASSALSSPSPITTPQASFPSSTRGLPPSANLPIILLHPQSPSSLSPDGEFSCSGSPPPATSLVPPSVISLSLSLSRDLSSSLLPAHEYRSPLHSRLHLSDDQRCPRSLRRLLQRGLPSPPSFPLPVPSPCSFSSLPRLTFLRWISLLIVIAGVGLVGFSGSLIKDTLREAPTSLHSDGHAPEPTPEPQATDVLLGASISPASQFFRSLFLLFYRHLLRTLCPNIVSRTWSLPTSFNAFIQYR
jgi:hypothetical protein